MSSTSLSLWEDGTCPQDSHRKNKQPTRPIQLVSWIFWYSLFFFPFYSQMSDLKREGATFPLPQAVRTPLPPAHFLLARALSEAPHAAGGKDLCFHRPRGSRSCSASSVSVTTLPGRGLLTPILKSPQHWGLTDTPADTPAKLLQRWIFLICY